MCAQGILLTSVILNTIKIWATFPSIIHWRDEEISTSIMWVIKFNNSKANYLLTEVSRAQMDAYIELSLPPFHWTRTKTGVCLKVGVSLNQSWNESSFAFSVKNRDNRDFDL